MIIKTIALLSSLLPIQDIKVGDTGDVGRVVIECAVACSAEPMERDRFFILGASADLTVETRRQSRIVETITLNTTRGGAILTVDTRQTARAVTASRCGATSLCFDFEMPRADPAQARRRDSVAALTADLTLLTAMAGVAGETDLPDGCWTEMRDIPFWRFWDRRRQRIEVFCDVTTSPTAAGPARVLPQTTAALAPGLR